MLHLELLILLLLATCQNQQDNKAVFGTSKAFTAHNATRAKINMHYLIILLSFLHDE